MRSVPMVSTGLFLIQFCIQLSFLSFCLPFFKLSFSFFRFKERLNGGQQCSCERVNLIIRYACGVLFLSRHFFPIAFLLFSDYSVVVKAMKLQVRSFARQAMQASATAGICETRSQNGYSPVTVPFLFRSFGFLPAFWIMFPAR